MNNKPNFDEIVAEIYLRCDGICEGLSRVGKEANFATIFAAEILKNRELLESAK